MSGFYLPSPAEAAASAAVAILKETGIEAKIVETRNGQRYEIKGKAVGRYELMEAARDAQRKKQCSLVERNKQRSSEPTPSQKHGAAADRKKTSAAASCEERAPC